MRAFPSPSQTAAAEDLARVLPGARVDFDPITASPRMISVPDGLLSDVSAAQKNSNRGAPDQFAILRGFLADHQPLFGYGPEILDTAEIKRDFVTGHNGLHTTVWQQQAGGLPILESVLIAHVTSDGRLVNLASQFIPDPTTAADQGTPGWPDLLTSPPMPANRAVVLAVKSLGLKIEQPAILAAQDPIQGSAITGTRLVGPGLKGPAEARLIWLAASREDLRLCWEVILTAQGRPEMYRVVLDIQTGDVVLRQCLTSFADASYRVYTSDSPSPFSPGHPVPVSAQPPLAERPLITISALNTNASPEGWVPDGVNETTGNNVLAHTDQNDDNVPDFPRPSGVPYRVFDFPIDCSNQDPLDYSSAAVVQLFYTCNWMHDRLYALGFTEAAGNFQQNNFSRGGLGNDPVQADAQDGGGFNNANFSTPPDGMAPRMQMYIFNHPSPRRDGSLDTEVVLHEYTHGLSNRRVGGGIGLTALQARGLGEGWSDFIPLALLSESGDDPGGNYASGAWISYRLSGGMEENYYFGIRRYPYSTNLTKNPLTFADIDSNQANNCASGAPFSPAAGSCAAQEASEVHNQGEVWCAILWEVRAQLIQKHGWAAGNYLALQLVCDGLNLAPPNPNFIQARDAILQADAVNNDSANRLELWAGFARRGLGFSALSPDSSTTTGVLEAFDMPDDLHIGPESQVIAKSNPGGQVVFVSPASGKSITFELTNTGTNALNWAAGTDASWLTLSNAAGLLEPAPGSATAVLNVSLNENAEILPAAAYTNKIWFTNLASGSIQSRQLLLLVGQPDYFSELFTVEPPSGLSFSSFTFTPSGSSSFYSVCRQSATNLPTSPAGAIQLGLNDDDCVPVTLSGTNTVALYATRTGSFFVCANGYLTFGLPDAAYEPTYPNHFKQPRIAPLFDDLNPALGGFTSWMELSNRVVVTYQDVPEYDSPTHTNTFQVELFYDGVIRITYLSINSQGSLSGLSAGLGVPQGFYPSDFSSYPSCSESLELSLPAAASESAGVLSAACEIRLPRLVTTNLEVTFTSSDTNTLLVPESVMIPAGSTNFFIDIAVVDDALLEPASTVTITAACGRFSPAQAGLTIEDDESAELRFELPATILEGAPSVAAQVFSSAAPVGDVTIALTASKPLHLILPHQVLLSSGQTSAVFMVQAFDNDSIDGLRAVHLSASVPNWTGTTNLVEIADNETTNLVVVAPSALNEPAGVVSELCRVQLSGRTLTNLPVSLSSSLPGRLTVSSDVVIPAGQSIVGFSVTPVDNTAPDGDAWVTITATAAEFSEGTASVLLHDDEIAPVVSITPSFLSVPIGGTAKFAAQTQGAKPIVFQWYFEGGPLPGATDSTLTIADTSLTNGGSYTVVASNIFGVTTSAAATLVVTPALDLAQALDQTAWNWETGGAAAWLPQTNITADGIDAARSGTISHGQSSWLQVTNVPGPSTIRFWWKVSSENPYDSLTLIVDGQVRDFISGEVDWNQRSTTLSSGTHTLRWLYAKDNSVTSGQDLAWLDRVEITLDYLGPVITLQPASTFALPRQSASFSASAVGQEPLTWQWRFNGNPIPGATQSSLNLPSVTLADAGNYDVVIANSFASVTSHLANLTVLNIQPFDLEIAELHSAPAAILEHDTITGDDRGGIALGRSNLFYSGDNFTGIFPTAALTNGASLSERYEALFSDLLTGRIYTLANGSVPLVGPGIANTLIEINETTGTLTTNIIQLTRALDLPGSNQTGIFAGPGYLLLHAGIRVYCVWLPWGVVIDLGPLPPFTHNATENWAYWGISEHHDGEFYVVYVQDSANIVRTRVPDGLTTVVSTFSNLADMANITVSPWLQRWFFHFEGSSQFGGYYESVGSAPVTLKAGFHLNSPVIRGEDLILEVPTAVGRTNYVEYKTNLIAPEWTTLTAIPGDGLIHSITNSFPATPELYLRTSFK